MTAKLVVATIHGMGSQGQTFANELHADLEARLKKKGVPPGAVGFCPLYWADLLEEAEEDLWENKMKKSELDWQPLRRFLIHNFADAVAYRRSPGDAGAIFDVVHGVIRQKLRGLASSFSSDRLPIVILAHSLGGAIMSDYIWERQKTPALPGETMTERLDNLVGIVTFGCNIPLFTLALPEAQPVLLPGPFLDAQLQHLAQKGLVRWENFYDPDDVLGWPLENLYDPRKDGRPGPVIRDHVVNVGGWLSFWNPKSHGEYWGDREFVGPVADHLHSIVEQL